MDTQTIKAIISGGGTGGHIYPAIAIANALKQQRPNIDILFIGAKGKMEMEKVPKAGYPIEGLWISGFHRKLTFKNLLFPLKLIHSLWRAYRILNRFRPNVVIGVGGFASGPTLEMAYRLGVPTLIQEQNSYAGITNRILAKKVNRICVAYPNMERFFPKEKIKWTGNPIRSDIQKLGNKRQEGYAYFELDPNKKSILLFGGSLGAKTFNEAMAGNTGFISQLEDVQIVWQIGRLYFDDYKTSETAQLPNVHIHAFLDRMDLAYAIADIVICRAGALTISELCMIGQPAVLVPSPNVAEDHQTQNALSLVENKAAVLVKDRDAKEKMLSTAIHTMRNEKKLMQLSDNIRHFAKPTATEEIAVEVLKLVQEYRNK